MKTVIQQFQVHELEMRDLAMSYKFAVLIRM
ncbi:hypothetical protein LCGC14_1251550, partial [marine sediment metagenome]